MGFLSVLYRRPAQQPIGRKLPQGSEVSLGDQSLQPTHMDSPNGGIPHALNFDRIMDGGTCPVSPPFKGLQRLYKRLTPDYPLGSPAQFETL